MQVVGNPEPEVVPYPALGTGPFKRSDSHADAATPPTSCSQRDEVQKGTHE